MPIWTRRFSLFAVCLWIPVGAAVAEANHEPPALNERNYALELGFAYAAAPLAAVALSASTKSPVGLLAFVAPPLVHVGSNRYGHAILSALMVPASTFGGALAGLVIDRSSCHNDDWFCGLGGFLLGGIAGYTTWAVIDTVFFSSVTCETTVSERPLVLSVIPLAQGNTLGGAVVGPFNL